ncbi:ROK family protein [Alistipes sp. OttesenSCG-928-B03]|nr:ROK family protein [Alistipes sp. OttesenSCG-928-B03]
MKKLAVGIDIGGTNTVFGLVDRDGNMYAESVIKTGAYPDVDQYFNELFMQIQKLTASVDFDVELAGLGIGAPNANYYNGTIENAANLIWKGVIPVAERMKRFFPSIPVIVTNDANAATIGEMIYGGARGMKDFILVTLGTGVGSGFVAGGKLIYGHDSFAGELGHITINKTGRQCGCGRKGCLETYASATGIKRTIFKLLADETYASEFRDVTYNNLTAEMITHAALKGDPLAIEAFEHTGMMLGLALANAVAVTSPEAIFLFGGLAKAGKYIFEPTKRHMEENLLYNFKDKVQLLPSALDDKNAAILGASALVWDSLGAEAGF